MLRGCVTTSRTGGRPWWSPPATPTTWSTGTSHACCTAGVGRGVVEVCPCSGLVGGLRHRHRGSVGVAHPDEKAVTDEHVELHRGGRVRDHGNSSQGTPGVHP